MITTGTRWTPSYCWTTRGTSGSMGRHGAVPTPPRPRIPRQLTGPQAGADAWRSTMLSW
ncbi:hypothetical protein LT493_11420 [Streptomyces tricolor]|nr:hypothetical protein [Streptomyces tricolor]